MATIQVEPGSKVITARLDNGVITTSTTSVRRISGASHIVHKPYQNMRIQFPGSTTFYTFIGNSKTSSIALPSGTSLVYRSK